MSVYDARYRIMEETPKPPKPTNAALTMSNFEIRRGLRGTWPKVPLILAGFIVFGFLVQMDDFISTSSGKLFWFGEDTDEQGVPTNPGILGSIGFMLRPIDGPGAIIIIHVAVVAAGLIAGDLQDRAIDLYFSKINLLSYFLSKIIAAAALTLIGMPLFTIIYFVIAIYKRWPEVAEFEYIFEVFYKLMAVVTLEVLFFGMLILVFSAYTTNPVNSGVLFVVFTLVSRVIFEAILYNATNVEAFFVASPLTALDVIRRAIIAPDEISDQFLEQSIVSYIIYTVGSGILVYYKLWREQNQ